jgi:hypothetical protein
VREGIDRSCRGVLKIRSLQDPRSVCLRLLPGLIDINKKIEARSTGAARSDRYCLDRKNSDRRPCPGMEIICPGAIARPADRVQCLHPGDLIWSPDGSVPAWAGPLPRPCSSHHRAAPGKVCFRSIDVGMLGSMR